MEIAIWLTVAAVLGMIPAYIAHRKGYSFWLAWFVSLIATPLLTLIYVLVVPRNRP